VSGVGRYSLNVINEGACAFGADAVDKVECPPGWRLPGGNPSRFSGVIVLVNDGIGPLKLALRLTNFLSECVGCRLMLSSPKVWESLGLRHFALFRGASW